MVVDPPFITRDVWALYAEAIKLCLKPGGGGRVIMTTVGENEAMLRGLLGPELGGGLRKATFMPAMQRPNLPCESEFPPSAPSPPRAPPPPASDPVAALASVRCLPVGDCRGRPSDPQTSTRSTSTTSRLRTPPSTAGTPR